MDAFFRVYCWLLHLKKKKKKKIRGHENYGLLYKLYKTFLSLVSQFGLAVRR